MSKNQAHGNNPSWSKHALEGDGNLTNLFHYLFKKNKNLESCPVRIPDTIVYEHNFPTGWFYFRDKELRKKTGRELETKTIMDEFSKNEEKSHGIVATFLSMCEDAETGELVNTIEFLDQEGLDEFLFKRKKREKGILQKFITPKGIHNFTIQAIWSPNVILTERRLNIHKLTDRKNFNSFERGVTYEGPSHYSQESLCSPHLEKDIKKICDQIASHFYNVEHKHITRMVLYFKVDIQSTLWLQWASSIRIASGTDKPLELSPKFTKPHDDSGEKTMQEVERLDEQIEAISQLMVSKSFHGGIELGNVNASQDAQLTARAMARLEQIAKNRENNGSSPLPQPRPRSQHDVNENHRATIEENEEFVSSREEVAELLDDLLYQAYSHFLHQIDAPFYFKLPLKLKEAFTEDILMSLMSQLNAHKDEDSEDQYAIPFAKSLSKIQHEYNQFKDLVLDEFIYQYEQREYEKSIARVPSKAGLVDAKKETSGERATPEKTFQPTPVAQEDDDKVLFAEDE